MLKHTAAVLFTVLISLSARADEAQLADLQTRSNQLEKQRIDMIAALTSIDRATQDFALAWHKFSAIYERMAQIDADFGTAMSSYLEQINSYADYMNQAMTTMGQPGASEVQLAELIQKYRSLKIADRACSEKILPEKQKQAGDAADDLRDALVTMRAVIAYHKLPHGYESVKEQMKTTLKDAETAAASAYTRLGSYAVDDGADPICNTFSQFDLLLTTAQALRANQAASEGLAALSLKDFLAKKTAEESAAQLKLNVERMLRGLEGGFLVDIRAGNVTNMILTLSRLDDSVAMVLKSPGMEKLTAADKADLDKASAATKANILKASADSGYPDLGAVRRILQTKGRNVQGQLMKVKVKNLPEPQKTKQTTAVAYCEKELKMKATAIFTVPEFAFLANALDFEAKLNEAQRLLKEVEQ